MGIPGNFNFLYPNVVPLTDVYHRVDMAAPEQARPQIKFQRHELQQGEVFHMPLADANYLHQFSDSAGFEKRPINYDPEKFMKYTSLPGV